MIADADLARTLAAAAALLCAAFLVGTLFERLRQPRVIGEIVGGLLLGPTVLGAIAPDAQQWLIPPPGAHSSALGLLQQLGLLLLMFCAGGEMRTRLHRRERREVAAIAVVGIVVPALVAAVVLAVVPLHQYWGPSANTASFVLVTCVAFAVTSIPVISRIMDDLGILRTPFARKVLGVAVIEDVIVYVALAIAVAIAAPHGSSTFGLSHWMGINPGSGSDIAVHVTATGVLLAVTLTLGRPLLRLVSRLTQATLPQGNPLTSRLVVLIVATLLALVLGVETYLAAFAAGIAVARASTELGAANQEVVKRFSFAFFVPIYFGLVGATLDLRHGFDAAFFVGFLLLACLVKGVSVYLGARAGGSSVTGARDLAVALNARGGPGIVLATVAYGAGIVNRQYYAVLVLLAVITSMVAGAYLARRPKAVFETEREAAPAVLSSS